MSTKGGPNMVTDGLTFLLDAANIKSYIGSGTNCHNLINLTDGTLSATTTYTSRNLGSFVFDGAAANIDFTSISLPTNITISVWYCRTGTTKTYVPLVEASVTRYYRFIYDGSLCYGNDSDVNRYYKVTGYTFSTINTWYNAVVVFDGLNKIYVNGVYYPTTQQSGTYAAWNVDKLRIGFRPYNDSVGAFNGLIPIVKIYNRALSEDEILQNYNALKGRFGK